MKKNKKNEFDVALETSVITIIFNSLLSLFKLCAGVIASSSAMISDGVHSASDVISTLIVIAGIKIASKDPDKEHPYGHERFECVAAMILSGLLLATGMMIGWKGMDSLLYQKWASGSVPGMLALWAAVISIVVKEIMFWYTKIQAGKIHSGALMADAWHHRSDALSSVGALIGIVFARMGYPFMDAVASVIICIFILKAAVEIFVDGMNKMVDKSCDPELIEEFTNTIGEEDGVMRIDLLQGRCFGNRVYVDAEIAVDQTLTLKAAHEIAEHAHQAIENKFPIVKHVNIHVNPYR